MEQWITHFMEQYGYWGIAFLIFLENIFPPIPSEVILTFGGFMTTQANLGFVGVALTSTVGSVVGAIALYGIGAWIGERNLYKIVARYGKVIRVKESDLDKTIQWFEQYGYWTIFFCRFVPLLRSLISIPAGLTRMNMPLFLLFTTIGTLIWNVVLIYLGQTVGSNWKAIVHYMDIYSKIIYIVLIILIIFIIWKWVKRQRKYKKK
ncbi:MULTISPECIES: DedA family protein [Staphylococcus]|jgi:membrane protein DedA with SNARE-associated domain|uniref:DedA family protein n=1 Tax=Staphylococcus nepalensis TaxID=214473 RepID=A0A291JM90_9STAP|nr:MULTISPECIES: DedA family protein [Staphylococcus]VDG67857.1 putative membrane-associated protein [Lacrimispora indolis]ATH60862.1 alkaline phosphatase [Staphylococcus nepalensis]ATH65894.1 alkaline phosphatase [Staphylococcus nepalensis]AWI45283.1 alkaline phosphatase [Staphylococcus nepalensis]MBO1206557.1 DedA family protein [Staphylococcus nepalensis]